VEGGLFSVVLHLAGLRIGMPVVYASIMLMYLCDVDIDVKLICKVRFSRFWYFARMSGLE